MLFVFMNKVKYKLINFFFFFISKFLVAYNSLIIIIVPLIYEIFRDREKTFYTMRGFKKKDLKKSKSKKK